MDVGRREESRREGRGLQASELRTMQRGNLPVREEICRRGNMPERRGNLPERAARRRRRPTAEREADEETMG
jgi:hypothetical protein